MTPLIPRFGRMAIERGEGRLVLLAAAILFLTAWASVSMTNVSETFFLKRIGVEFLPIVFLANSILLVATTGFIGRVGSRVDHTRLPLWTFAGLAIFLVPLWVLVVTDVRSVFILLVLAAKQLSAIALLVFWMVVGGLLHGRQAKRLSAPIMAGGTLGTILGSFASGPTGNAFGIASLVPVAAAALVLAGCLTIPLMRLAPARLDRPRRPLTAVAHPSDADDEPTLGSLWRESWLFRPLAASAVLSGLLGPMLYFQFSYVADLATQGSNAEMRLLNLYAQFRGWINVAVLAVQLVGTSRIFRRIGLPLASAVSPLVYFIGFTGLSVRLSLPTGIGAVAGARLQDHAVYDPAQKTLFTLFSERLRPAATALIDGPLKRAGGVIGNIVILCALAVGTPISVGYLGLPFAAVWFVVAIGLWRAYPTLLLEASSRRRAHPDDALPLEDLVDHGTVRLLESYLVDQDVGRCRAACELVVEASRDDAVDVLARAVQSAPPANRPLLIDTLHRLVRDGATSHPDAARNLEAFLTASPGVEGEVERANAVRAYGCIVGPLRPGSTGADLLERLCDDPSGAVRLAATAALHRTGADRNTPRDLDRAIEAAVAVDDTGARLVACAELRAALLRPEAADGSGESARWNDRLRLLTSFLSHPDGRAEAAGAVADIAARHGARAEEAAPAVLAHAEDADARVRAAVARFIGHTRLEKQARWLVERLTADDDQESMAAADALRTLGPAVSDVFVESLHLAKRSTRNALLPILRDIKVDEGKLRELVDAEMATIASMIAQSHVLASGRIAEIVQQRLGERADESIHTTLLLLAALLKEDRITRLCRLLGRTREQRDRAVLYEALEALLPPRDRARLMPLLEGRSRGALPRDSLRVPVVTYERAIADALADDDALTRALMEATLDDETRARAGVPPKNVQEDGNMLSGVEIILHLKSLAIFEGLSTRQLADLAGVVREEKHPAETVIVREGEYDDCMYLIVDGTVRISKDGRHLADLGPGDFFGEMAVLDAEQRSATATAASRVRLLRLERHDLFVVMDEQPAIAITICQTLTRRVRELNDRVQALQRGEGAGESAAPAESGPAG